MRHLRSQKKTHKCNTKNKQVAIMDDNKKEVKHKIDVLDDIYQYSEDIINAAKKYV